MYQKKKRNLIALLGWWLAIRRFFITPKIKHPELNNLYNGSVNIFQKQLIISTADKGTVH